MSKLYTKTGDKGTTCLYDMRRVPKGTIIIDFLGDLDELSAHIGLLCAHLAEMISMDRKNPKNYEYLHTDKVKILRKIQLKLLDIGSNIATSTITKRVTHVSPEDVKEVESWIDECEKHNTPLKEFILPGVKYYDSQAHICRAVCRRVERKLVNLHFEEDLNRGDEPYVEAEILQYLNRLSDYFFALARFLSGCSETTRSQAQ